MAMFIDSDFKCHVSDDGTLRPAETDFFDGKTTYFIESYRFVPAGERWINPQGIIFRGEMVSPWRDYSKAAIAQDGYNEANTQNRVMISELASGYESGFVATRNYDIGSLIVINNKAYETINAIPNGGMVIIGQNVVETNIFEYVKETEEDV